MVLVYSPVNIFQGNKYMQYNNNITYNHNPRTLRTIFALYTMVGHAALRTGELKQVLYEKKSEWKIAVDIHNCLGHLSIT